MKGQIMKLRTGVYSALLALSLINAPAMAVDQILLPDEAQFPESIAISENGDIYTGSVTTGHIVRLPAEGGEPTIFVEGGANGAISIGGLLLSPQEDVLYACSSDLGLNQFSGTAAPGLLAFDIESGDLTARWDLPGGGLCNDLVQAADGTIYVTDSFVPRILALKPGADAFETLLQDENFAGDGFNLSGIALLGNSLIVAKFNSGQFFRIDLDAAPNLMAEEIALDQPIIAPDGMRALSTNQLIATSAAGALAKLEIEGNEARVTMLDHPLNGPTSLALHKDKIYATEGQLDKLSGEKPTQFTIAVIPQ
jgi:sugar lactone lactonase YvrE